STKEGDHGRASYLMRTGYLPQGPIQYPTLGALVSRELGDDRSELPNFVSISPVRFANPGAYGSGFLGPVNAPLIVGETSFPPQAESTIEQALRVQDLAAPPDGSAKQIDGRIRLLT